jgi:glyoxalase family protein
MSKSNLNGLILGLHHITLITSSEELNRRFYTELLGLKRVKLTVNQDDVYHRHLFYADEKGTPGSAITFFEWPELPHGSAGLGSPHHLSYTASSLDALVKWKSWLTSKKVSVVGPLVRDARASLYLRDPDGVMVEITALSNEGISDDYFKETKGNLPTANEISEDMKLTTFNHASPITSDPELVARFFEKFLDLKNNYTITNPDQNDTRILAIGNEEHRDFLRYLSSTTAPHGFVGDGSIHHIAMAVEEDEDQLKFLRRLNDVGIRNSGIIDRFWFKSLYFRDPEGNLLEIATKKPGYAIDEPMDKLGSNLVLPKWLEPRRPEIQAALKRTDEGNPRKWPPSYPPTPSPPETLTMNTDV